MFDIRKRHQPVIDQDLGLLHAYDEQFAAYGWLTNTGTKFVIIVDMEGEDKISKKNGENDAGKDVSDGKEAKRPWNPAVGLRDADLKPVCQISISPLLV